MFSIFISWHSGTDSSICSEEDPSSNGCSSTILATGFKTLIALIAWMIFLSCVNFHVCYQTKSMGMGETLIALFTWMIFLPPYWSKETIGCIGFILCMDQDIRHGVAIIVLLTLYVLVCWFCQIKTNKQTMLAVLGSSSVWIRI